jgi:hypothetical protein
MTATRFGMSQTADIKAQVEVELRTGFAFACAYLEQQERWPELPRVGIL